MSYPKHPAPYTTGVKITRFVPGAAPAMGDLEQLSAEPRQRPKISSL